MRTLIGICTKHNKEGFQATPTYKTMLKDFSVEKNKDYILYEGAFIDAVVKTCNNENIGKHYNKVLKMALAEGYETVILMHDDIHMDDHGYSDKLLEAFKEYDIVGLAGAKQIEIKQPALWHLMSKQEDWSGAVAHPANDKQIFMTSFGPTPQRCLVLDGLFLAIKVSSLNDNISFDENIPAIAHHYDLDFCLTANKNKLKLTTWPIWVVHKSPGLEKPDKGFHDSENYFINKWLKN
jgi:GT2 family glycosyltransferase